MEARTIQHGYGTQSTSYDLAIIQGELKDIKELLTAILQCLNVPIPTSRAIDGSLIYPAGPLPADSQGKKNT